MTMKVEAAELAVLGSPVHHSKSPVIHAAAYAALELPWSYNAIECDIPDLPSLLQNSGPEWRGFSLTMPLKEAGHRLATVLDPVASESGVVNTLLRVIDGPNGAQWAGFNTDVPGLAAALNTHGYDPTHTVVLGAGATATSAVMAARALGARQVTVIARRGDAAAALAQRFDGTAGPEQTVRVTGLQNGDPTCHVPDATLIISTLPGNTGAAFDISESLLRVPLFDVAYDPWPSPLAQRWDAAGTPASAGIDMLVEQAIVQVRIFVGGDPHTPVANEAVVRARMVDASVGR